MAKREKIVRRDVTHVWAHQTQSEARTPGGRLYFNEDTIYSYGSHFPIARHVKTRDGKGPAVLFTTDTYSPTTAGHIRETRCAIPPGVRVFYVSRVTCEPGLVHLQDYMDKITEAILNAGNTKLRARAYGFAQRAEELVNHYNEFSAAFKLRKRAKLPKDWPSVRKAAKDVYDKHETAQASMRARRATDRAEGYKRQLAAFDQAFAGWKAGKDMDELPNLPWCVAADREVQVVEFAESKRVKLLAAWIAGESVSLPHVYGAADYLRVKPGNAAIVETSRHVEVERGHVERVLPVVLGYLRTGKTYQQNGHTIHVGPFALDQITADGTVIVGCHRFERREVLRFANVLQHCGALHAIKPAV